MLSLYCLRAMQYHSYVALLISILCRSGNRISGMILIFSRCREVTRMLRRFYPRAQWNYSAIGVVLKLGSQLASELEVIGCRSILSNFCHGWGPAIHELHQQFTLLLLLSFVLFNSLQVFSQVDHVCLAIHTWLEEWSSTRRLILGRNREHNGAGWLFPSARGI